jgi:hypothetical protein
VCVWGDVFVAGVNERASLKQLTTGWHVLAHIIDLINSGEAAAAPDEPLLKSA